MKIRNYVVFVGQSRVFVCLEKERNEFKDKMVNEWSYDLDNFDIYTVSSRDGLEIEINNNISVSYT